MTPLTSAFYKQPTLQVARNLLGKLLVCVQPEGRMVGRIVEVEAYHQDGDEAAHSFGGQSRRNEVMFGPPGFLYVYFIYGMHYCMNVVTEDKGIGAAVLIRAFEPVEGVTQMQANRGPKIRVKDLTNGPAKCCQAFGIDGRHNGKSLSGPDLFIADGSPVADMDLVVGPRIGISKSVALPWRFYLRGNAFVSKP